MIFNPMKFTSQSVTTRSKYDNAAGKLILAACTAIVMILATGCSQAQDAVPNPVPNFSFEAGADNPTGWSFTNSEGSTGRWGWDTQHKSDGQRALKMVKANSSGYYMLVSDYIPLQAGKNYVLEADVRLQKLSTANVVFMVSQYKPDSDGMDFPNAFSSLRPLHLTPGFDKLSTRFTVREGNTRVRIHVLTYLAPVELTWDNFTIREASAADNYQPVYEAVAPENLPPLAPVMEQMKQRKPLVAERRTVAGRTRLFIDGKMTEPLFYVSPFPFYDQAHISDFQKAGVHLYTTSVFLGDDIYGPGMWKGKGQFDFSVLDQRLWRILRVDPNARIVLYLATDPYRKWAAEHPDAIVRDQNGKATIVDMHVIDWGREPRDRVEKVYQERYAHSFVSQDVRDDTTDALRRLAAYIQTSDAGKAIVGIHLAGGSDGQYFHWQGVTPGASTNASNIHLDDYSEDSKKGFRDWLLRRYKTEAALQKAWNRPSATFATVEIPTGARRLTPGFFFDPQTDQDIIDFNRFYSEGTAESLMLYAKVMKEATGRRLLISAYWEDAAAGANDHAATGRLLESNDIDFMTGPTSYGVRMPGESGGVRSMWSSLALHNRLWVSEQDWRSIHSYSVMDEEADLSYGRARNAEEHNAMVRRESGMMLAFGQGSWWFDMDGGWFADAGIMAGVKEARQAFTRDLSQPGAPRSDVAVFVDESSYDYLRWRLHGFGSSVDNQVLALATAGVPYHLYLQSDLPNLKQDYKLYIFANAHHISGDEWKALQKLKSGGRTLAFVHAPGVVSQATLKAKDADDAIYQVTGISVQGTGSRGLGAGIDTDEKQLAVQSLPSKRSASTLAISGPIASGHDYNDPLLGPVWAVNDAAAQPLGIYEDGRTGAALKKMKGWNSVFVGGAVLTDTFLNSLARFSGAWVASDAGDAVYANQNILTAHAISDGEKKLTLAQPSQITDLTTGKLIAQNAASFSIPMKRGETRWFALKPLVRKTPVGK